MFRSWRPEHWIKHPKCYQLHLGSRTTGEGRFPLFFLSLRIKHSQTLSLTFSTFTDSNLAEKFVPQCYEHNWEGPTLGPKPTGQKKDWPENILRASEAIVPSQYGSNKFASQKGVRFGAQRDIINNVKLYEPPKKAADAPVEAAA